MKSASLIFVVLLIACSTSISSISVAPANSPATSGGAQLNAIAFSALAFFTGDFNRRYILPLGKVADFGASYLRD